MAAHLILFLNALLGVHLRDDGAQELLQVGRLAPVGIALQAAHIVPRDVPQPATPSHTLASSGADAHYQRRCSAVIASAHK